MYGSSDGKIFQDKYRPAGILFNANATIYFKFNCN
jgi:hypothetical protein